MKQPIKTAQAMVLCLTTALTAAVISEHAPRQERFKTPPLSARILPLHHGRPDDRKANDNEIADLRQKGFGGMGTNLAFSNYMTSEEKWQTFLYQTAQAHQAGMALWLYDECGYPSGTAGDLVMQGHPEWEARGLLIGTCETAPGTSVNVVYPPGRPVRIIAFPVRNNRLVIKEAVTMASAPLTWTAPTIQADAWRLLVITESFLYEGTHAAKSLARKEPYINLLMREPTARFIELTHEAYAKRLGENLRFYTSTFTDEPSLMSCWMAAVPYRVIPWAPDLAENYHLVTGRNLLDDLPAIIFNAADVNTSQCRYDFWNLIGNRVAENYMGQITDWCTRHQILSGGHLLAEEGLESHVPYYGNFFKVLRRMTAPGIDCLTSLPPQVPWLTALIGGSAADLNGARYCMCEASDHSQRYRPKGDTRPPIVVTQDEVLGSLHRLVWGGVNTFTSYYGFSQFTAEQINDINTRIGRVITMTAGTQSAADIALLYPAETLMTTFSPLQDHVGNTIIAEVASTFRFCGNSLFTSNRSFILADSVSLEKALTIDKQLVYKDLRWRMIILPSVQTIPLQAMKNLHDFWQNGGCVIAVGDCPQNSTEAFPSADIRKLTVAMFGTDSSNLSTRISKKGGTAIYLPKQLTFYFNDIIQAVLPPALTATNMQANGRLRTAHRRSQDGDTFLVINDSSTSWHGTLKLNQDAPLSQWVPETGNVTTVAANGFELAIPPYGARIYTSPKTITCQLQTLGNSKFQPQLLPLLESPKDITSSHPPCVKTSLTQLPDGSIHSVGTLLQSKVDTFHFTSFNYDSIIIPEQADGLSFEVSIPDGQPYASKLFVFLILKDGRRFLADTNRSLNVPGKIRAFVNFSSFVKHAHDNPEMNLQDIASIQIGWGGYFGITGQTITLDIFEPQAFIK